MSHVLVSQKIDKYCNKIFCLFVLKYIANSQLYMQCLVIKLRVVKF